MRGEAVSLDIKSIRSLQRRSPSEQSWDRYVREVIPKRRTTQSRYQSWIKNHTRSVPDRFRMESNRLVPSRDICEQCHWPAKFDAVKLRVILHFQDDAANTQTQTALMMLTGGGDLGGIHGKHMGAAAGSQAWGQRASISSSTTSSHPPPVRRWKHLWFAPAARGDTTIETGAPGSARTLHMMDPRGATGSARIHAHTAISTQFLQPPPRNILVVYEK